MTSREFVYWLQGYFEITAVQRGTTDGLTALQVECIKNHLAMVFIHEIDPSAGPKEHQAKLDEAHKPQQPGPWPPHGGPVMRC